MTNSVEVETAAETINRVEKEWIAGMSDEEYQIWFSFEEEDRKRFLYLAYKIVNLRARF